MTCTGLLRYPPALYFSQRQGNQTKSFPVVFSNWFCESRRQAFSSMAVSFSLRRVVPRRIRRRYPVPTSRPASTHRLFVRQLYLVLTLFFILILIFISPKFNYETLRHIIEDFTRAIPALFVAVNYNFA